MKKATPFDVAFDQYNRLKEKLKATQDIQEKNILFRRLANLLDVMEFLNANLQ